MGHAQHLLSAADTRHLLRHLLRRPTGNAGIHLVEYHRSHAILLAEHILHGQHDPRQLAAGGDLVDRPQLLAHVGGHQEPHRVHAVAVQRLLRKVHGEAYLPHVQLLQFGQYLRRQPLRRRFSGIGQRLRRLPRVRLRAGKLLLQPRQCVARVLDLRQLLGTAVQIVQHVLHRGAVLLFQPVQLIHAALHPVQLAGRHIQLAPLVLHRGCNVVHLAVRLAQPLIQLAEGVVQMAHTAQRVLCLPQGAERTAAAVVPVEGVVRPGHGIQKPLRIA